MSDSTPRKTVSQVAKEWGDDNTEYVLAQINDDLRARIAELEKAFSLLIAVTVNGRIIKGRVGDYYQPQVPVAEIDNARKALKESGE